MNRSEQLKEMSFASIYPLYVKKVERKGRTEDEVATVLSWLTGYTKEALANSPYTLAAFFDHAPALNPNRSNITGSVCGVKLETIQDPLLLEIRRMDKVVDELAKGKSLEKIMR